MAVTEEDIAKVLQLVPSCPTVDTVDCLRETEELQHLTIPQIQEALHILEDRGQVARREMLGRDFPS
jgi:hypothetical protein